jgi:quinohemoprotein ethanol dehydrogenase
VALDAATGRMRWYYQTTPADTWDYTATQDMALTELELDGRHRKVLLQAPKNGFFYVLDRETGALLRAHPYVKVTWATHVDLQTGRPVENPAADFTERARRIWPGPLGGHNWQAMAFDPARRLVYLPSMDHAGIYALDPGFRATGRYERNPAALNLGFGPGDTSHLPPAPPSYGYLQAFDPLTGETRWRVTHRHYFNGGVLATAGDLVFQGDAFGTFAAYDADTGERLWSFDTHRSILAPPITYRLGDTQYVALLTATGGAEHYVGHVADTAAIRYGNAGRLLVFALDRDGRLPAPQPRERALPEPPPLTAGAETVAAGNGLYHSYCANCHGALARSAGVYPDLRRMSRATHALFDRIVRQGLLAANGMAGFGDVLASEDAEAIRQYLIARTREDRAAQRPTADAGADAQPSG